MDVQAGDPAGTATDEPADKPAATGWIRRRRRCRTFDGPGQPPVTVIFFTRDCATAVFGSVTVSTPFLNAALASSVSTPGGKGIDRWNEP